MSCLQHHCFAPHVTPAKRGPLPAERALRHVSSGDTFAPDGVFWQLSALDNAAVRDRHIPASSACTKLGDRMAVTNNNNPNGSPKFDTRPFIAFAPSDSTFTNRNVFVPKRAALDLDQIIANYRSLALRERRVSDVIRQFCSRSATDSSGSNSRYRNRSSRLPRPSR